MANLYEIEQAMLECVDLETGEILDEERLTALNMERDTKIENLALWYKNLLSDAEQYKAEKNNFAEKERKAKAKAESIKNYLDSVLAGGSFKSARNTISYRKSETVVVDDMFMIGQSFLKYAEPTVDKVAVKKAIKDGQQVQGVHLEEKNNIQIK